MYFSNHVNNRNYINIFFISFALVSRDLSPHVFGSLIPVELDPFLTSSLPAASSLAAPRGKGSAPHSWHLLPMWCFHPSLGANKWEINEKEKDREHHSSPAPHPHPLFHHHSQPHRTSTNTSTTTTTTYNHRTTPIYAATPHFATAAPRPHHSKAAKRSSVNPPSPSPFAQYRVGAR